MIASDERFSLDSSQLLFTQASPTHQPLLWSENLRK